MDNNLKLILEEFEIHKGEFVISGLGRLYRFIGISEDKDDYYYVLYNGKKITFETALIKLIYLKGKIDNDDYDMLEQSATLNHDNCLVEQNAELLGETIQEYKNSLIQKHPYDKFHTELIFKSN